MKKIAKAFLNVLAFIISIFACNWVLAFFHHLNNSIITINFMKKVGFKKNVHLDRGNYFKGLKRVSISDGFESMSGLFLATYSDKNEKLITFGKNFHCSKNCHIGAINKIEFGDNVLLGSNVTILDHSHGETNDFTKARVDLDCTTKGPVVIGDNTWIGDNCVILSGVTLGKNCVVGANSVVNKSFPDNSLIAGCPAKIIKTLV